MRPAQRLKVPLSQAAGYFAVKKGQKGTQTQASIWTHKFGPIVLTTNLDYVSQI